MTDHRAECSECGAPVRDDPNGGVEYKPDAAPPAEPLHEKAQRVFELANAELVKRGLEPVGPDDAPPRPGVPKPSEHSNDFDPDLWVAEANPRTPLPVEGEPLKRSACDDDSHVRYCPDCEPWAFEAADDFAGQQQGKRANASPTPAKPRVAGDLTPAYVRGLEDAPPPAEPSEGRRKNHGGPVEHARQGHGQSSESAAAQDGDKAGSIPAPSTAGQQQGNDADASEDARQGELEPAAPAVAPRISSAPAEPSEDVWEPVPGAWKFEVDVARRCESGTHYFDRSDPSMCRLCDATRRMPAEPSEDRSKSWASDAGHCPACGLGLSTSLLAAAKARYGDSHPAIRERDALAAELVTLRKSFRADALRALEHQRDEARVELARVRAENAELFRALGNACNEGGQAMHERDQARERADKLAGLLARAYASLNTALLTDAQHQIVLALAADIEAATKEPA